MELRDLQSFVVVAEELHFGRAAARLHISAPPLTRRIKLLEKQLGALLFRRTKRSVALTEAGNALLDEARRILLQAAALPVAAQRAARGEVGSAMFSQARQLQSAVTRSLPGVRLVWHELNSLEQIHLLRQNRLDIGFINTPIDHEGIACGRPVKEPMVIALPVKHRLARRTSLPLGALKDETFILGARHLSPGLYDRMIAACGAAGFSPHIDHQANHMFTYIGLVAIGAGVSLVPRSMAQAGMAGVSFVAISGRPPHSEVAMAWNPNHAVLVARVLELTHGRRSGRVGSRSSG